MIMMLYEYDEYDVQYADDECFMSMMYRYDDYDVWQMVYSIMMTQQYEDDVV